VVSTAQWRHPFVRQWTWLVGLMLAATALMQMTGLFWRTDLSLYDAAMPTRPAPADVVIVAIDEASITQIGRWPWRRAIHAALLDRLRAAGARAVALDLLFTEPDNESPQSDAALAAAMAKGPPTVLPLIVELSGRGRLPAERLPIPLLLRQAAGIGHVNLELDRDGVARSVFLREGLGAPNRQQFALALLNSVSKAGPELLSGDRHPDLAGAPEVWVRDYRMLIPFLGPPGHFQQLSYVDVLRGSFSPSALHGKLVLVGVTAQGFGDAYPTPRSGEGYAMPGVEVSANILQALRAGSIVRQVPTALGMAFALVPILGVALAFLRLSPRGSLIFTALCWLGTLGLSAVALRLSGWWWPPASSLATLLVMYPLWSWRRLEAKQAYLEEEFARLEADQSPLLTDIPPTDAASQPIAFFDRRIELLRRATQRLRDVRQLLADTINSLPDAMLLVDREGRIALANPAAAALFGCNSGAGLENASLDEHLSSKVGGGALTHAALAAGAPQTLEAAFRDTAQHVLIRSTPFFGGSSNRLGTIIVLADISELRAAQREREDIVRFLSHDMKSPASSLLGLAHLQRDPTLALPAAQLSQRLDLLAQRMLTLVDGFIALARAESADPTAFSEFDLRDAIQDGYDEVWATAEVRKIQIVVELPEDPIMIQGDRQLLGRALVNLLANAVKFSPIGSRVWMTCLHETAEAVVTIRDQGPGISPKNRAALFQRFSRARHAHPGDPGGTGLGLAFVRVAAQKHNGRVWIVEDSDSGAEFRLAVPSVGNSPPHGRRVAEEG